MKTINSPQRRLMRLRGCVRSTPCLDQHRSFRGHFVIPRFRCDYVRFSDGGEVMFKFERLYFLSILILLFAVDTHAQTTSAQTTKRTRAVRKFVVFVNPPTLAKPTGYTHAVVAIGGGTRYIAAHGALYQSRDLVCKEDFRPQTPQSPLDFDKA